MKKCAVIIAAYNCPEFIIQCYNSVKNQLPISGWSVEIRIGVDGCKETSETLKNIKHYYSDENVGHLIMRNSLIKIDKADCFLYFDSDDVMEPNFLSECLKEIDNGHHLVIPAKIQCNENLQPIKDKPVIQSGGAMVFTHKVVEAVGGFPPYRCAGDTDFMERAKMAGFEIFEIKQALYQRRLHENNLTRSGITVYGGEYRKEVWQKMTEDRENGIIKIIPQTTPLKTIEPQELKDLPVYLLIRTSNRPIFFSNMMKSIQKQTYKNIITIVHTDNPADNYAYGDILIHGKKIESNGNAPYNLYCNTLLENVPDTDGYYMFLDDDDIFFDDTVIERFIKVCKPDHINICRVMRWNFEIFPKRWRDPKFGAQTECFMIHAKHKNLAQWWDKKGGDYDYSRKIQALLPSNFIDDIISCKPQEGKGNGKAQDFGKKLQAERPGNICLQPVLVTYIKEIKTPSCLRGNIGDTKIMQRARAEHLEIKGKVRISEIAEAN